MAFGAMDISATNEKSTDAASGRDGGETPDTGRRRITFGKMFKSQRSRYAGSTSDAEDAQKRPEKWSMGVLNDRETDEVPGKRMQESKGNEFESTD